MGQLPYVLVKCAMSLDGYIDDGSTERLLLSDEADFVRVDLERAACDAILVGAQTIRNDNPKLLIRAEELRNQRMAKGIPENPTKITVTASGNLSRKLKFFTEGNANKIVYCKKESYNELFKQIGDICEVVAFPYLEFAPNFIIEDLSKRNFRKLMIEGGSNILTQFIGNGLVDEIQVSIAPIFVGECSAPSFVNQYNFPHNKDNRMKLEAVEMIGDMALITYKLKRS